MTIVTRESLNSMLESASDEKRQHIIGRALAALLARQTEAEKRTNQAKIHNGAGFSSFDVKSGTITAKSYIKYGCLFDWQVAVWMKKQSNGFPRICKYASQLDEIAQEKAAKK